MTEESFLTATEFLDALSPLGQLLSFGRRRPNEFLFRGHSDARFRLLPSAYRPGTKIPVRGDVLEVADTWTVSQQIGAECESLMQFFWYADGAGLSLPGDGPGLRSKLEDLSLTHRWPIKDLFAVMALAQNHGLPTRLLDWSRSGKVAAYFAAKEAAQWCNNGLTAAPPGVARLSVWILHTPADRFPINIDNDSLIAVTAPRSSNRNLHAQQGAFTLLQQWLPKRQLPFERVPLDALLDRVKPPFKCFHCTLPIFEAPALLHLLALDGVCASSLFPGYGGVVDAMKEENLWISNQLEGG